MTAQKEQNMFTGLGLTLRGIISDVSKTKKDKFMYSVVAGKNIIPVISELNTRGVGELYEGKVNLFATEDGKIMATEPRP